MVAHSTSALNGGRHLKRRDSDSLMGEAHGKRGVLTPNRDRAVWPARVTLGEWQQDFTLLRFPASRLWPDPAIRPDTCHGTIQPLAGTDVGEGPETPPAASQSVMDEPLARVMPAPTSPRVSEPPAPAVEPPGSVTVVVAPTLPVTTITEAPAFTKPMDLGQAFLAWLKQGLLNGELPINTVHSRVHRVREGVLLVSPGIFRDYGIAVQAPWASIQKRFQKLRLHRKTPEGFNIWNYTVVGERRTRELKGILVDDAEKALGPDLTLPPPNVHVVLVGKEE